MAEKFSGDVARLAVEFEVVSKAPKVNFVAARG